MLGNVGDSRAVLGTRGEDGALVAVQLTVDLKPSIPGHLPSLLSMVLPCVDGIMSLDVD